jgi:hypothetical protein
MSRRRTALPPWDDDAAVQAWVIAELDKADDAFQRKFAEDVVNWLRYVAPRQRRSEAESRKRTLTIGRRAEAKHRETLEQRAVEEGDTETLRRLNPRLAQFINPARKSGRPRKTVDHDPLSPEARLKEASDDIERIRKLLKQHFGHVRRPPGAASVTQIAAERWGLDEVDVAKGRISSKMRERLARQR